MVNFLILIAGFLLLIKGAEWLVDGASSLGKRLRISNLVIGLTVVAFGTSTPELFVNIFASLSGDSQIAIGNILGSNIANILLILGISSIIYPLRVTKNTVWKEIPFTLLASALVLVLAGDAWIDHQVFSALTRIDGIVLLAFFVVFMVYLTMIAKSTENDEVLPVRLGIVQSILWILFGLGALVVGGKVSVNAAVRVAAALRISQSFVGLTIVAVGTSLPELATSVVAACRKNPDIAVGNIVGSNIFNIFFILGISACIAPLPFIRANAVDAFVSLLASLVLFLCMFTGGRRLIDRWEGAVFLLLYAGYVALLIHRG